MTARTSFQDNNGRETTERLLTTLKAINQHAAIHVCLAAFFAACSLAHYVALLRMDGSHRQF